MLNIAERLPTRFLNCRFASRISSTPYAVMLAAGYIRVTCRSDESADDLIGQSSYQFDEGRMAGLA